MPQMQMLIHPELNVQPEILSKPRHGRCRADLVQSESCCSDNPTRASPLTVENSAPKLQSVRDEEIPENQKQLFLPAAHSCEFLPRSGEICRQDLSLAAAAL